VHGSGTLYSDNTYPLNFIVASALRRYIVY